MRVAVLGAGAVGARVAQQVAASPEVDEVVVADTDGGRAEAVCRSVGAQARAVDPRGPWSEGADVAVLAFDAGRHVGPATRLVEAGVSVVSTSSAIGDVRALLALDAAAAGRGLAVAVGASMAPGLSCVLAAHAAARFDVVHEIHVARMGTGGPACARQHHHALHHDALEWRDGEWLERRGGAGRELSWFPDPVGARDCYQAALPDALLLLQRFPEATRISGRLAATRRDRFTMGVPMLRRPHPEGRVGAVRVEVRGQRDGASETAVYGAIDRPAAAAGTVAAVVAVWLSTGRIDARGAGGLAALVDPVPFLSELARRGVKAAVFEGAPVT